ncbi:MAG: hypothetical protein WD010_11330 [Nitriliruptor sp.]|uniref:hypothetical protein n=1 Tax=Nitriliruptor sp. TaxID=2448056 RepID=UPI0034A01E77
MAKALMGTHAAPSTLRLLDEVRTLRQRVADLERALATAEAARDAREDVDAISQVDDRAPAAT